MSGFLLNSFIYKVSNTGGGAGAFPVVASTYAPYSNQGNVVFLKPSGTSSGDMLLAFAVGSLAPAGGASLIPPDSNWISIQSGLYNLWEAYGAFYKIANTTEPNSYIFTSNSDSSYGSGGFIARITGQDSTQPINTSYLNFDSSSLIWSGQPTTVPNCLVLRMGAADGAQNAPPYNTDGLTISSYSPKQTFMSFDDSMGGRTMGGLWAITQGLAGNTGNVTTVASISSYDFTICPTVVIAPSGTASAPAAPVVASSVAINPTSSTGGNVVLSKPAGTTAGDLLVSHVMGSAYQSSVAITPPAGWTQKANAYSGASAGSNYYVHALTYYKIANTTEPNTYTFSMTSTHSTGVMARITGANSTTPIKITGVSPNYPSSTPLPTLTFFNIYPVTPNCLVLQFAASHSGRTAAPYNTTGLTIPGFTTQQLFYGGSANVSTSPMGGFWAQTFVNGVGTGNFKANGPFDTGNSFWETTTVVIQP